jgi:predicted nucleotidyltransferase
MLTPEEIMEKIEGNMENIKKYGVKRIGLFGSYVRNEQKSESESDLKPYIFGSVKYAARIS